MRGGGWGKRRSVRACGAAGGFAGAAGGGVWRERCGEGEYCEAAGGGAGGGDGTAGGAVWRAAADDSEGGDGGGAGQGGDEATGVEHVPVFWLATEDHDLEEVDQVSFLTKTSVETLRAGLEGGACGAGGWSGAGAGVGGGAGAGE